MAEFLPDLTTWNCFACGQDHPKGLRLQFTAPSQDRIRSEFQISTDHVGLGRVVHGGIVATVFDEIMVWTLYRWRYQAHVTATMQQKFRSAVEADTPLVAEAWIAEDRGRRRTIESHITNADGSVVLANASGLYLPIDPTALDDLPAHQITELQAVFDHFRQLDERADV